jgi:radical SAM superfamily enzyme YgiQ (UPF0313 family)
MRYLRDRGVAAAQDDLSLRLALRLFSSAGLARIVAELRGKRRRGALLSPPVRRFLGQADRYVACADAVLAFLQGKDPALALRIATRRWLPEGPRFRALREMETATRGSGAPGRISMPTGAQDRARHLASLFLDDLADVVRDGVDPRFAFARYAEDLAIAAPRFDPIRDALRAPAGLVERLLDEVALESLTNHAPDLVGVTAPFPGTVCAAFRIARAAKAWRPGVRTVLGGGYVSTELRTLADLRVFDFFDFVTLDDGETPLLRIVEHLRRRRPAAGLVRTFIRRRKGVAFMNDPGAVDLPHGRRGAPLYDGLPLADYTPLTESTNRMHSLWSAARWNKLMLAHGCYWRKCAFCDTGLPAVARFAPASARTVAGWMRAAIEQTGQAGFHFVDEAAPPALLRALAAELARQRLAVAWWGNIRFERAFTRALAARLARSGCVAVSAALETACDRTLRLMRKGVTLRQAARAAANFARAGILVHAYLIYGFPSQTEQETVDALEYVRQLFAAGLIQSAYWHRFALTVHSPIFAHPERYGIRVEPLAPTSFARNEVPFEDPTPCDHTRLGPGLRKAAYNFMHGVGLDEDVRAWFDSHVPRPTLPRGFVRRAISGRHLS